MYRAERVRVCLRALLLLSLAAGTDACSCIPPSASSLESVAAVIASGDEARTLVSVCFPGHHSYAGAWDTLVQVNGADVPWHSAPGAVDSLECVGNGGWIDWDRTPEVRVGTLLDDDGADLDVVLDPFDDDARIVSWAGAVERDLDVSGVPDTLRHGESFTIPMAPNTSSASILPDVAGWLEVEQVDADGEVVFNDPAALRYTVKDEMPLGLQRVTLNGLLRLRPQSCEGFVECAQARVIVKPRALALTIE